MKAGRRLVEDVEDAPQPAPGLRGQPDALDLAAGERVGGAVEAQVAEPEAFEEAVFPSRDSRTASPAARQDGSKARLRNSAARPRTLISLKSAMVRPATVTRRDSGLRRRPPQARQASVRAKRRMLSFLLALRMVSMTGRMPL